MDTIFRIQDHEGRGPWRPGFSKKWVDVLGPPPPPPYFEEFPNWQELIKLPKQAGLHHGCGCRSIEQMRRWFTKNEMWKLRRLGFAIVTMDVDEIIAESDNQVIFARLKSLNKDVTLYENKVRARR